MRSSFSTRRRAFTLVELLIVIVVIGILIAIIVPSFIGVRDNARDAAAKSAVTVSYHNAKALWAHNEAFPDEVDLTADLETAEPNFSFFTATPTSENPEDVWVDTEAIAGDDEVTICSQSGSGTWFCLRADETGTHFVSDAVPGAQAILAAAGDTIARSRGGTLEIALCYLPSDQAAAPCDANGAPSWSGDGASAEEDEEPPVSAPVSLSDPVISGTTVVGQTLSTTNGGWSNSPSGYTYQWQRDTGSGFSNISGATAATYTLAVADVDADIQVIVTATNVGGSASATSASVGPVLSGAPVNLTLPSISGSAQQGATLTVSDGTWSNGVDAYTYQWRRDTGSGFVNISGATSSSYVLTAADSGADVTAVVTATNAYGAANATAAPVGPVLPAAPVITSVPVVSGTPVQGQVLTATVGTWDNNPTSYAYQWQRNSVSGFVNISGANASSYTVAAADGGWTVRVRVTATNAGGSASGNSASVGPAVAVPANTAAPNISGAAVVGQTLTVTTGTWTQSPASYTYQWQRDTGSGYTNISGATSDTYTVGGTALGGTIRVRVSATNAAGTGGPVSSNEVGPVEGAPVNTAAPVASGTANAGETLSASNGTWSGTPTSYSYQWQYSEDGSTAWTNISGATSDTYVIDAAYLLEYVRVRVTAANTHGSTQAYSAARGPVDITDPIVNGDFEGGFTSTTGLQPVSPGRNDTPDGWTITDSGNFSYGVLSTNPVGTNGDTHYALGATTNGARNRIRSTTFTSYGGVLKFDVRGLTGSGNYYRVRVLDSSNTLIGSYDTGDALIASTAWSARTFSLSGTEGQTIKVEFSGTSLSASTQGARIDNVRVTAN